MMWHNVLGVKLKGVKLSHMRRLCVRSLPTDGVVRCWRSVWKGVYQSSSPMDLSKESVPITYSQRVFILDDGSFCRLVNGTGVHKVDVGDVEDCCQARVDSSHILGASSNRYKRSVRKEVTDASGTVRKVMHERVFMPRFVHTSSPKPSFSKMVSISLNILLQCFMCRSSWKTRFPPHVRILCKRKYIQNNNGIIITVSCHKIHQP